MSQSERLISPHHTTMIHKQSVFGKPKASGKPRRVRTTNVPETSIMGEALRNSRPLLELKRYKVVKCPRCGVVQCTEASNRFTCVACEGTYNFRVAGKWAVKLIQTHTFTGANLFTIHWKEQEAKGVTSLRDITESFPAFVKQVSKHPIKF